MWNQAAGEPEAISLKKDECVSHDLRKSMDDDSPEKKKTRPSRGGGTEEGRGMKAFEKTASAVIPIYADNLSCLSDRGMSGPLYPGSASPCR